MTMPGNAGTTRIDARALAAMLGRRPSAGLPACRLLAREIGRLADAGELPPGDTLPAERALAAALKVSRGTVTRAYQALRDDGRARTRPGQGTRVTRAPGAAGGTADNAAYNAADGTSDGAVADLATAAVGCASRVAAALQDPASLPHFPERSLVTDTPGCPPFGWPALRQAIADMLTAWHGIPTTASQVLVTTGTRQALDLLIRTDVLPGQTVVTEDPTYPGVLGVLRRAGTRPAGVPPGDVERLARAVSTGTPALAYLVPTHQNPTGLVLPTDERHQIVDLARQHPDVTFVDDMTLADLPLASGRYADGPQPPPLAALVPRLPNVVTVGSLAKLYWGGLRTGWIRAPEGVIARLAATKAATDPGGAAYQQAIVAALIGQYHEEIVKWRSDWLQARYDALAAALRSHLPAWEWTPPQGGLTIWARPPADLCGPDGRFPDSDALARAARDRGVAVTPGSLLSADGAPSPYVRLAFTLPPEDLAAAVRTLSEV